MLGPAVGVPAARAGADQAAFGGDDQVVGIRVQRLGDQPFTDVWAVGIGGVDEVDAEFHHPPQRRLGLVFIRRLAPDAPAGDAHRAEAQPAYHQVAADLDAARRRRVGWIGHAASLGLPLQFLSRQPQPPTPARPAASVAARAARNYRRRKGSATSAALTQVSDSSGPLNQWPTGHRIFMLSSGPSDDWTTYWSSTSAGSPHRSAPWLSRYAGQSRNIISLSTSRPPFDVWPPTGRGGGCWPPDRGHPAARRFLLRARDAAADTPIPTVRR